MDLAGKKLMILGAGRHQMPLIQSAIDLGLETHVCSIDGDYPGIAMAPNFHAVDISNQHQVLSLAKALQPDGILTTATDVCLQSIGTVVDELGLHGSGLNASSACLNKAIMKQKLVESGVPTAQYRLVENANDAIEFFSEHSSSCVIKPVDSSGSRGVTKVSDVSEIQDAFRIAKSFSRTGGILIEEWLEGEEFGAQAIVRNKRCELLVLHSDITTAPPRRIPVGHGCPHPEEDHLLMLVQHIVNDAIECIDINDTISNIDFILTGNGPKIIELTCRMGGTRLPEVCGTYWGLDFYALAIQLALGLDVALPATPQGKPNAAHNLILDREGRLAEMDEVGDEFVHEIYFKKGQRIAVNAAQQAELGFVQLIRDDAIAISSDLVDEVNRLTNSVRIEVN